VEKYKENEMQKMVFNQQHWKRCPKYSFHINVMKQK